MPNPIRETLVFRTIPCLSFGLRRVNMVGLQTTHIQNLMESRDVIRRLCNKDRDQGQKGIGVRYRSCSDIQYIG